MQGCFPHLKGPASSKIWLDDGKGSKGWTDWSNNCNNDNSSSGYGWCLMSWDSIKTFQLDILEVKKSNLSWSGLSYVMALKTTQRWMDVVCIGYFILWSLLYVGSLSSLQTSFYG